MSALAAKPVQTQWNLTRLLENWFTRISLKMFLLSKWKTKKQVWIHWRVICFLGLDTRSMGRCQDFHVSNMKLFLNPFHTATSLFIQRRSLLEWEALAGWFSVNRRGGERERLEWLEALRWERAEWKQMSETLSAKCVYVCVCVCLCVQVYLCVWLP